MALHFSAISPAIRLGSEYVEIFLLNAYFYDLFVGAGALFIGQTGETG